MICNPFAAPPATASPPSNAGALTIAAAPPRLKSVLAVSDCICFVIAFMIGKMI
jgi:hypothetical protein